MSYLKLWAVTSVNESDSRGRLSLKRNFYLHWKILCNQMEKKDTSCSESFGWAQVQPLFLTQTIWKFIQFFQVILYFYLRIANKWNHRIRADHRDHPANPLTFCLRKWRPTEGTAPKAHSEQRQTEARGCHTPILGVSGLCHFTQMCKGFE